MKTATIFREVRVGANKTISGGFAMLRVNPDPSDMVWYVQITIALDTAYGRAAAKFVEDDG